MFNRYGALPEKAVHDLRSRVVYSSNPPPSPAYSTASSSHSSDQSPRRDWRPMPSPSPSSCFSNSSSTSSPRNGYLPSSSDEYFIPIRANTTSQIPSSPAHSWASNSSFTSRAPTQAFDVSPNGGVNRANQAPINYMGNKGLNSQLNPEEIGQRPLAFYNTNYAQTSTTPSLEYSPDSRADTKTVYCKYCLQPCYARKAINSARNVCNGCSSE